MDYTALHVALGPALASLSNGMVDDAIASGVEEAAALDWKRKLFDEKAPVNAEVVIMPVGEGRTRRPLNLDPLPPLEHRVGLLLCLRSRSCGCCCSWRG